jgi:hypothetical protein
VWVITTRGFFSAVAHHHLPEMILVRARAREDLEGLGAFIGHLDIEHTPERDYAYRTVMQREQWSVALGLLAAEIDYPNFKNAVAECQGDQRADIYHRVWFDLTQLRR